MGLADISTVAAFGLTVVVALGVLFWATSSGRDGRALARKLGFTPPD